VRVCAAVGIFPFRTVMTQGKMKMGYVEVETQPTCRLFPPGAQVRGHVFHFSEMVQEQIVSGLSGLPDTKGWDHAYRATMQTPGAQIIFKAKMAFQLHPCCMAWGPRWRPRPHVRGASRPGLRWEELRNH